MAQQLEFIDDTNDRRIVAAPDRVDPAVWVAELRVLRELGVEEHQIARRMRLRRGMNILWAKEPDSQRERQLFEDSISGHSAGKTTFCRSLRYILGESHFGDEQLRQEIRRAFSNGWIAGEVYTSGSRWAVYRPIGIGAHPFVVRDASLDDALAPEAVREPLDVYRNALNAAAVSNLPIRRLPASAEDLRWDHILPWLARDQDCHFAGLTTWRDAISDSDSPQLDATDRQLLLRAILGLISDEENNERRANDERNAARKSAGARRPALLHQAAVDRKRLEDALGASLPPFDEGLFESAVSVELDRFEQNELAKLNSKAGQSVEEELEGLEQRLQHAVEEEAEAAAAVKEIAKSLDRQQAILDELNGSITEERRKELLEDLGPSTGFCNVPIMTAIESGCPLANSRPISLVEHVAEKGLDERAIQQQRVVGSIKAQLIALQGNLTPLRSATAAIRSHLQQVRRAFAANLQRVANFKSHVSHLRRLAKDAQGAWIESNALSKKDLDLKRDIDHSYKRQDEIREQLTKELVAFSERFNHFISALLGEAVEGRVVFSGRDIELKVLHRGERRSAAIKIVTNIAFDLAALTGSIEGRGFHPRFLVHDGPREADMSPGLYRKVFLLVRMLEECVTDGNEPAFQYIITTTEAPPTGLQSDPWLLEPVLDAADPSKRFLGVDL